MTLIGLDTKSATTRAGGRIQEAPSIPYWIWNQLRPGFSKDHVSVSCFFGRGAFAQNRTLEIRIRFRSFFYRARVSFLFLAPRITSPGLDCESEKNCDVDRKEQTRVHNDQTTSSTLQYFSGLPRSGQRGKIKGSEKWRGDRAWLNIGNQ